MRLILSELGGFRLSHMIICFHDRTFSTMVEGLEKAGSQYSHSMRTSRRPSAQRGFTLVESLIAIIVVFLGIMAMLSVIPFGFSSVQTNSLHAQAIAVGQRYVDDERNAKLHAAPMPIATAIPVDAGQSYVVNNQNNTGYGNFAIAPNGCAAVQSSGTTKSQVDLYSCSATVTWTETGAARSVTVQSYVIASK